MRSRISAIVASLVAIPLAVAATVAAAAGGNPSHIPVATTMADTQNGYSLRVGSDTKGVYLEGKRTITSAIERFSTGTDWMLNTYYGAGPQQTPSGRTVFFDLREPASTANPTPPFATGYAESHLIAKCRLVNVDLLKLEPGTFADCPGSFRFQAQATGAWYRFSFQPENFPQVDRLRVTCLSKDAGGCKVWTITPSNSRVTGSDPNPKSLNRLLEIDDRSEQILAELGDYYLSFFITVVR